MLSLMTSMKGDTSPLPIQYSLQEAETCSAHGRIAFDERTEDSARRAVIHFENQLEVSKGIGDRVGILPLQGVT